MKRLLVILLSLFMVFPLIGCGSTESPSDVTDRFFKAVKERDAKTVSELYEGDDFDLSEIGGDLTEDGTELMDKDVEKKFVDLVFDFDYEVGDEEIKDDNAVVKVKMTSYALGEVFSSFYSDFMTWALENMFSDLSEEEMSKKSSELFAEKLDKVEKTYTEELELKLVKKDNKWLVSKENDTVDLMNAMTGDLGTKIKDLSEAFDE